MGKQRLHQLRSVPEGTDMREAQAWCTRRPAWSGSAVKRRELTCHVALSLRRGSTVD